MRLNKNIGIMLFSSSLVLNMTSCTDNQKVPAPNVKDEIIGDTSITVQDGEENNKKNEPVALTYAVYGEMDREEYQLIKQFNESDNGYVIVTKNYSEIAGANENGQVIYDENKIKAFKMTLMQDMANGEIDIVRDLYLGGAENMDIFSARGSFVNLYDFMDDDESVNSAILNEHILKLHEMDGNLYTLPTYFTFNTLIGQTRYVGSKEGWTLDEFISKWEQMPEGSTIEGHREKDKIYNTVLYGMIGSFIDYKNATTYFNSPEFKKSLEFCNTFENISNTYVEPNFASPNFVSSKRFFGFANTHYELWNEEGESYTFVGYPSNDGCGGFIDTRGNRFAICASTTDEERKGAWEFIKTYCLEDYQKSHYCKLETIKIGDETKQVYLEPVGFPMNVNVYNQLADEAMAGKHMEDIITQNGVEINIGQLTQDELNRLSNYINSIQNLTSGVDSDLETIINDEVLGYFNGEKTVEQCIDYIQNRAEIMVSEKQ